MNNDTNDRKVVRVTRDTVVATAAKAEAIKEKSRNLARKAGEASKRYKQKVSDGIKKTADDVAGFGKDINQGVREGIEEVRERRHVQPLNSATEGSEV